MYIAFARDLKQLLYAGFATCRIGLYTNIWENITVGRPSCCLENTYGKIVIRRSSHTHRKSTASDDTVPLLPNYGSFLASSEWRFSAPALLSITAPSAATSCSESRTTLSPNAAAISSRVFCLVSLRGNKKRLSSARTQSRVCRRLVVGN